MPQLQRAVATLRVMGDDLDPGEVSALLGAAPTISQVKGQDLKSRSIGRLRTALTGMWRLDATVTEPEDLDSQVVELLSKLTSDLIVWRGINERYEVDLFCGWFMDRDNVGVEINPATLQALGERGIRLSLDIYGSDTRA
jgi:hypothetical protein